VADTIKAAILCRAAVADTIKVAILYRAAVADTKGIRVGTERAGERMLLCW
jgi:hypothetical protein